MEEIIAIKYIGLNELQKESLEKMKKLAKSAHFINICFRDNGQEKTLEADFLRDIILQLK